MHDHITGDNLEDLMAKAGPDFSEAVETAIQQMVDHYTDTSEAWFERYQQLGAEVAVLSGGLVEPDRMLDLLDQAARDKHIDSDPRRIEFWQQVRRLGTTLVEMARSMADDGILAACGVDQADREQKKAELLDYAGQRAARLEAPADTNAYDAAKSIIGDLIFLLEHMPPELAPQFAARIDTADIATGSAEANKLIAMLAELMPNGSSD